MLKFLEGISGFSNDGIDSRSLFRFLDVFFFPTGDTRFREICFRERNQS